MSQTATNERPVPSAQGEPHNAKRSAALFSVLAAFGVTLLKLLTGLLTGSLGMLSEAAHSGIDLIAAGITLFSVHVSDRPADADHTYGHGKIESLSAAVDAVLMLASCVWILTEPIHRVVFRAHPALKVSIWPFVVLLLAITVDFTRSRQLHRIASETKSEALEADAIHFRTDIWSSIAVLLGLAATYTGQHWHIPQLEPAPPHRRHPRRLHHPLHHLEAGPSHHRRPHRRHTSRSPRSEPRTHPRTSRHRRRPLRRSRSHPPYGLHA